MLEKGFRRATYTSKNQPVKGHRRFFVIPLLFFTFFFTLAVPHDAHAGFLSFLDKFFQNTDTKIQEADINSQNVALLQAALNYDPNPSKGGGDITIVGDSALLPDSGPLGTIADVGDAVSSNGQISLYVVREGDSLSGIAKMFGVSVNTIIWANDIKRGDLIREGQVLTILPVSGVSYTVLKGDTLDTIAKKFKGDVDEIKKFNDIADSSALAVGQVVIIPAGEVINRSYSARGSLPVSGSGGPEYVGYYLKPVIGSVKTQGLHGYNGVDLAAPHGREIMAAASGYVIIARDSGWNGGYGQYVVVSHPNETQTLYSHMDGIIVNQGAFVVQGQVIGYIGSTGQSTGPHLHFEVRGAKNPF